MKEAKEKGNENIRIIENLEQENMGITVRRLTVNGIEIRIAFINQLTDRSMLINSIIRPILAFEDKTHFCTEVIAKSVLIIDNVLTDNDKENIVPNILKGFSVVALANDANYIVAYTKKVEKRSIEAPEVETVFKGPKDSLTENIDANISLIRYRIKDPGLRINMLEIGRRTKTKVGVIYIDDIVNKTYLDKIKKMLSTIDIDGIMLSGYIPKLISEDRYTLFPVMGTIERSEKACIDLLEGKIIILVEGGGAALAAPQTLLEFLNSSDDYFESSYLNLFIKTLRIVAMMITIGISAVYVTVVAFHPDILPSAYILAIAESRATVPFNALTEAFLMEFIAEILREASFRLPKQIGAAVGIVGTIVIGQAAVTAGLVSPLMVIIVALSLMCSFVAPNQSIINPLRLIKFGVLIITGIFGLFGFVMGILAISINIISTSSFGVPYLVPFAPYNNQGLKKFFLSNIAIIKKRSEFLKSRDKTMSNPKDKGVEDE